MPPAGPKGEGNLIFTVAYVISKRCKNPEAAWEVINYLTGIENQTTVLRTGFALPSRKALLDDPYFEEHPVSATIFRGAEIGTPFMWGLHGSDVNDQMAKALERIYLEGVSCEANPFIRLISVAHPSPRFSSVGLFYVALLAVFWYTATRSTRWIERSKKPLR